MGPADQKIEPVGQERACQIDSIIPYRPARRPRPLGGFARRPSIAVVGRLLRQLSVDAFDVPIHAQQGAVIEILAGRQGLRAILFVDRPFEGMQFAGLDLGFRLLGHLCDVGR